MSKKVKNLKWGETPFDKLTKGELLIHVWRMFSALQSANTVLNQLRDSMFFHKVDTSVSHEEIKKQIEVVAKLDGYWGKGTGARGFYKVEQALQIAEDYSSENIYRSFFRYAEDLLFDRSQHDFIGDGWAVCGKCGVMLGESNGESMVGKACQYGEENCDGTFRELQWSDLKPEKP